MAETIRLTCKVCGYTTTIDVGATMSGEASGKIPEHKTDSPNICPQCGGLTLEADGVEAYWD